MIVEYIKSEKTKRGLSNQELSNLSGVPIGTVNRVLSGQTENPSFQTICDLILAMDCSVDAGLGLRQTAPLDDRTIKLYQDIITDKNKWLKREFILLCFTIGTIVAVLLIDILNPTVGFIRY